MSRQQRWAGLLAGCMWAFATEGLWAITITSPVMPGDVFAVNNVGSTLFQFRWNTTTSTVTDLTNLGGVTTDGMGNLWFAHGDGSAGAPFQIEMIPFAGTTSVVKLSGPTLNLPANAAGIRDILFDSAGTLYASVYLTDASLRLYKYLPDGAGGFQTGVQVGSFGGGFGDYGGGRLSMSVNELFIATGVWGPQRLYSMRLTDGTMTSVNPGTNVASQTAILPSYPNLLLYSAPDGVRTVSFNQLTGEIGTSSSQLFVGDFNDGLVYSAAAGRLYLSNRANSGEIRFATNAQLASAISSPGSVNISDLGLLLQSGNAYINRDLAVIAPPPYPGLVQQGDIWIVDTSLRSVHQFRGGTKVSTFTLNADDMIGGVATDANANLYIAGTGLGVYRIDRNTNQVSWLLKPDEVAGSGLTVRDVAVAADGTLYITYYGGSGRVDKFTPDGAGGYTRTTLGTTGLTGGDRGNHHSWLTNNGQFLLTSGRGDNKIVAMNTSTSAVSTWATSIVLNAEIALDPLTNNYVLFGGRDSNNYDHLYALPFDPTTGTFGTTPIVLNTDTDDWVDALAFDPLTGDLYMSVRYNQLVKATYAQYLLALAGSPFDIDLLPRVYTGSEVNIARDMVVTNRVPEPAAWVLLGIGLASLPVLRRRFPQFLRRP